MTLPTSIPAPQEQTTQLAIVGGGPGGYVAALYAAKLGLEVTLVEKDRLGGTCLNVGCIPTKTLVAAAELYAGCKKAQKYGIHCGDLSVDMAELQKKKNQVVSGLVGGVEELLKKAGVCVLRGEASFQKDQSLLVTPAPGSEAAPTVLRARDTIIATGSRTAALPIPGLAEPWVLDSTRALELTALPASITIIGGGVIGMEFAFLYANLGVKVSVVEYLDQVLAAQDDDVIRVIERAAARLRVRLYTGARVTRVERGEDGLLTTFFEQGGQEKSLPAEAVLSAVGRVPCIQGLGLEELGVALNEKGRGIRVDDRMRTSLPHLYAIGDVNNRVLLAHVASNQGMIAVDAILGRERAPQQPWQVPGAIFTAPEVAQVGWTEKELQKQNRPYKVSTFPYAANGRAQSMGKTEGFVKLLLDEATGELCGGAIVGEDAGNLISTLCVAIGAHLTPRQLADTIYPHPTLGEMFMESALAFTTGSLHSHT